MHEHHVERRHFLKAVGGSLLACGCGGALALPARQAFAAQTCAAQTGESQAAMTPELALQYLEEGNARFVAGTMRNCNLAEQVAATGAGQHPLIRQLLADATGLPVETTTCPEPVLLGSAILGAVAAGRFPDIRSAMPAMSRVAQVFQPSGNTVRGVHDRRFDAFLKLQSTARDIRRVTRQVTQ